MHTPDFLAAPLAAGNTPVHKPAPETPLPKSVEEDRTDERRSL
jgi:acyl-CoA reductase-like NAD-dependent aldehyde dehydrogenase